MLICYLNWWGIDQISGMLFDTSNCSFRSCFQNFESWIASSVACCHLNSLFFVAEFILVVNGINYLLKLVHIYPLCMLKVIRFLLFQWLDHLHVNKGHLHVIKGHLHVNKGPFFLVDRWPNFLNAHFFVMSSSYENKLLIIMAHIQKQKTDAYHHLWRKFQKYCNL